MLYLHIQNVRCLPGLALKNLHEKDRVLERKTGFYLTIAANLRNRKPTLILHNYTFYWLFFFFSKSIEAVSEMQRDVHAWHTPRP